MQALVWRKSTRTHSCQNVLVPPRLHVGHLDAEDALALGRELLDDVALEAAEHDRLELAVQVANLGFVLLVCGVTSDQQQAHGGKESVERTVEVKVASELEPVGMQKVHERQQLCTARAWE